ncbi:hypothetical protein OS493_003270 [Desmophyllum pertusum]|uniref:Polycystic kidney disease protein 1-like 2 n=1 Tax=Desmophyllum pertusum TaxID=174260 RepID=A0A9W9YK70_9CNID|nr:hypothetical protein OS493_003270 [Desmophyllum pertusum]
MDNRVLWHFFLSRCLINCDKVASVSTRISVTTTCTGQACNTAKYQWQLVTVNSNGDELRVIILTRDKTETDLNLPGIIIKDNQLTQLDDSSLFYQLKVSVSQDNGPSGNAAYQFRMNAPPSSGRCTVTPQTGEALKTKFDFICSGWQDPDTPLMYEFHYKTDNGLYTVVSYGSVEHVTTVLPPGKKENDYQISFEIMVTDSLSAANHSVRLSITVTPAPADENLRGLTVGNSSQFNQLVQSGDVRGATQLANAVLQTADQSDTTTTQDKIAIKDSIVKSISGIEVRNLQSLTQVTSVIARATLEPNEVTFDTQNLALQTLSSMTSLLQSKTREDYASESVLVEQGGENLVLSLGNLLNSAAQKASVISKTKETVEKRTKSENVSRDTEKLIDNVGTALLSKMMVDQDTYRVQTRSIDMELNRLSPRSLKTNKNFTKDDKAGFKFSLTAITDDKATYAQYIDTVMTLSGFNPFTWDNSSALVKSHVLSLNIRDHNGDALTVQDSNEDIEIKIPRGKQFIPEKSGSFFVKPSSKGKMQFHEINLPHTDGSAIRLRINSTRPTMLSVFVRYGQRPTVTEYDAMKKIPDESCSLSSQNSHGNCGEEAYDIVLFHELLSNPGTYYIGMLYEKDDEAPQTRKKRSCFGQGRQKRSCVEFKDPPRPENITVKPVYDPRTDLNYTMSVLEEGCLFWDSRKERWLSRGCRVGQRSNSTSLHCLCNHLTSFGGGVLVMPNTLDFDVVFNELTRLDQTNNIAVLSAIIVVLLLYLLVVIFARRADKRDKAKSGPAYHLLSSQEASFEYDLTVVTGVWKGSGTDANVAIVIHGSEAESQPIILNKNMINSRTVLARGNEDTFVIHLPMSLGEVQYIHVWHDNSGKHPSWFFGHAVIKDRQTGGKWTFLSNSWFALEKGDGKIDRLLTPISPLEMKTFKYSLNSRGSKSFSEGHLWLSVITKPPWSKFTRVQRTTSCLCLLMSAMLANAMFYRTDKVADPTIQIGPLKFSWRQIVVGLESAVIVTPINLLIVALFKNSADKSSNKVDTTKTENKPARGRRRTYSCMGCTENSNDVDNESNENSSFWTRTLRRLRASSKKSFMFPHFCIYIAWFLSFATVSVSAMFTFFYSLQWGKDIANQWLSSMLVSFTEDLFVLQPIKILLIMVVTAYFFSNKEAEVINHQVKTDRKLFESTEVAGDTQSIKVDMPHEDELQRAREYRVKEAKMFSFVRELVGYLLFLLLLTIVCYGNKSYHGYLMTKNIQDTFSDFSLVSIDISRRLSIEHRK